MAWAISDKEDSDTLQAVWRAVNKRCSSAIVSTVMTDDGMHAYTYRQHISNYICILTINTQIQLEQLPVNEFIQKFVKSSADGT